MIIMLILMMTLHCSHMQITARMICASSPGKDACQGDSGGWSLPHIIGRTTQNYANAIVRAKVWGGVSIGNVRFIKISLFLSTMPIFIDTKLVFNKDKLIFKV